MNFVFFTKIYIINYKTHLLLFFTSQKDFINWQPALTLLYVEAVARAIKNDLFTKLRKKMEEVRLPLEAPYRKVEFEVEKRFFLNIFGGIFKSLIV